MTPMAHSHSRLQVFSQCPLAYKLQYIDKVPAESSDAMEIGAAAHEFFEHYVLISRGVPKEGQWKMCADDVEKLAAKCFQKEARNQDNFKEFLEICQIFANEYRPDPEYPVVIAEQQLSFKKGWEKCEWNSPEVMFRAKIDRIELPAIGPYVKKIRITDYKTGFSGAVNSFQLDVYALIASLIYPALEQVEIQFYYVKSGFKQVKVLEVKDLDITKIQIEALMERIEGETKWKPKPGARCLNCNVAAHCTAKSSDLVAITTPDIASTLGTEIALLEAQARAKKKALNVYCRKCGPVEAGGLTWNHFPVQSMAVDMGPFLSACVSYKVDPSAVLNPDKTAILKAMKATPGFSEAIIPYVNYDVSTRFSAKKSDGDDE